MWIYWNSNICQIKNIHQYYKLCFSILYILADKIVNSSMTLLRRVWRDQRDNQNSYFKEQTTQWRKEKVQKEKQQSARHTYQAKGRVTRVPLKTGSPEGSVDPNPLVALVVLI